MSGKDPDSREDTSYYAGYHTYPYSYGETEQDDKAETDTVSNKQAPVTDNDINRDQRKEEKSGSSGDPYNGKAPASGKKSRKWQYITIIAVLLLIVGSSFVIIFHAFGGGLYPSTDKVAVIYVQGTLLTSSVPGGLGYATSEGVTGSIREATADANVKAIILRINSPGGSSTAGEEIYTEVRRASESGVPVIVSMGDVAASAAYHISAPADLIVANPSTMTGSIGTIWMFENLSGYYEEEGVEYYIAKSGDFKDMGGSWRGLTEDEKEYANLVVAEVYANFVEDIAEGRSMSEGDVRELADGRIYTGQRAMELGLVDELGNFYYALDRAAALGGIEDQPTVVYMNRPTLSSLLFGSEADTAAAVDQFLSYYEESPYGRII
ncbi:signal peptide peptidase SppA [Methanolobus halotolerans]|uniref:Signal peptide peptidase SppA n=1 Tax=Methanolobus halotolerans TaxID=2052935 RepID=A0A4E0QRD4_9EURY|nr:signal peptide peptidase SppA [Methanolobus halotolerans]TGC08976.1 signal peptide peptidase SppA [Methanolobus halotolerans]